MSKMTPVRPLPVVWPDGKNIGGYTMLMLEWEALVADYEAEPTKPGNAWRYLSHHPAFWRRLDWGGPMSTVVSDSWYDAIEGGYLEDPTTKAESYWLEIKPQLWDEDPTDEELEAVAPGLPSRLIEVEEPTHDEALIIAASIVHDRYGNDREFLKLPQRDPEDRWYG